MTVNRIVVTPDPTQGAVLQGKSVTLPQPLILRAGERQEIFLSIRSVQRGASTHLEAAFLSAASMPPTVTDVTAYRPDRALNRPAGAPSGVALLAGSLPAAQLIGLETLPAGGSAPRISVWPKLQTQVPMDVTLTLDPARIARGLTASDYHVQLGDRSTPTTDISGNTMTFKTRTLDRADVVTDRSVIETDRGERIALPGQSLQSSSVSAQDTSACKNSLISRRAEYEQFFMNGYDAIRIFDCENVAPYMHIVLIDRSKRNRTVGLPVTPSVDYPGQYVLRPITSHGAGSAVAVNGFTWSGDDGTYVSTGYGVPLGTLITDGIVRKKTSTTEAILGFQTQPADKSRGTSAEFFIGASSTLNFGAHNYNVIGSTTSVIRSGACNPNLDTTNLNRWSAVGIGYNRMALISSTSGGTATPRELCSVFEGLGYLDGAIRLDGGPSASMAWLGEHINPLTGAYYVKYGNARNILNALVWK